MKTSTFHACNHRTAAVLALGLASGLAGAAEINTLNLLNQAEFKGLSEDMGAALSFKPLIPAESMGITGFDIGVAVTATTLKNKATWSKAAGGADIPATLPVPTLRVHKGLPFDIDIGVVSMSLPDTNVRATGGELRWAFVGGNTVLPAVALRVSGTSLSGVSQLKMRTLSGDISISKGFAFLTPYAGVGSVEVKSSAPGTTLREENFRQSKVFAGLNIALTPLALVVEADRTGDATSYGIKLALRW